MIRHLVRRRVAASARSPQHGSVVIAAFAFGIMSVAAPARGQDVPVVRYRIRLAPAAAEAVVTLTVPPGATRLSMDTGQARHLPEGWATFVRGLAARGPDGALAVERDGPGAWRLPGGVRGPITLDYRVDLRFTDEPWPAGNEQAGARFDDAIYAVGRALFIDVDAPGPRRVTFEVPAGACVSAPWRPVAAPSATFDADDADDLLGNSLVVGTHASVRVASGPFDLELALPGAAREAAPLVDPVLRRVLAAYLELLPGTPSSRYLMTFFYAGADDGESFRRSAAFTTADPVRPGGLIVWGNFLAHELFHFWNGQRIRGAEPRTGWRFLAEGFTEYYANVTLAREGLITPELFLKKAERHLGNYLYFATAPQRPRMSLVDAGTNTTANRFGVYDGGWTLAFCLDGLVRERSNGRASLDDLMRELWLRARSAEAGYSIPDLDVIADRLAGGSLGGFVTTYAGTTTLLPVRDCLARAGLAGAFKGYAAEVFLFADPEATAASRSRGRALYGARGSP